MVKETRPRVRYQWRTRAWRAMCPLCGYVSYVTYQDIESAVRVSVDSIRGCDRYEEVKGF